MIFAASTDDRTLLSFASEADAIAYCEAIDVEAGEWLFWDDTGLPLEPEFIVGNRRGLLWIESGSYRLITSSEPDRLPLLEVLGTLDHFNALPPFSSVNQVRAHLSGQRDAE